MGSRPRQAAVAPYQLDALASEPRVEKAIPQDASPIAVSPEVV